jgi:hypothetical protein
MDENTDAARVAAIRRLRAKRMFIQSLAVYVVVNTFLVVVWAMGGRGYFWPAWVMAGWGVGLALQAWHLYGRRPITEDDIQRELRRGT